MYKHSQKKDSSMTKKMVIYNMIKRYTGYVLVGIGVLCGLPVGYQMIMLEINWNYFPTRDYQPGTISGVVDLFHRVIETFYLLASPDCLPFILAGIPGFLIGNLLLGKKL